MHDPTATLFDLGVQPWDVQPTGPRDEDARVERERILTALAESQLGTMEQRLTFLLQNFPETRDSDTALAIRYWERFQAETLEKWNRLDLDVLFELDNFETISRLRRHIQNDLGLFVSTTRVGHLRSERQLEFYRYLAEKRQQAPEIRFYLDETGADTETRFIGVAGICILDWRQYEKHYAAFTQWRRQQGWPQTLHFRTVRQNISPHLRLLQQLERRRPGLLFLGYALPSRGATHPALVDLFIQLVVDSLKRARELGCLNTARSATFVKEADEGFDRIHLPNIETFLAQQLGREFPDLVYLGKVKAIPKGREPFLECADLIAGAMQRRALWGRRKAKDELAEAVMNVVGFEDKEDASAVYKAFLP